MKKVLFGVAIVALIGLSSSTVTSSAIASPNRIANLQLVEDHETANTGDQNQTDTGEYDTQYTDSYDENSQTNPEDDNSDLNQQIDEDDDDSNQPTDSDDEFFD